MTIQIIGHNSGRAMVVGARYSLPSRRVGLNFANYLTPSLPPPPAERILWTKAAAPYLKQVLLNDKLGDCTCAGVFHIAGALLANLWQPVPFTDDDVQGLYERACGYNPSNPSTDQGGNEQTVLDYIIKNGLLKDGSHAFAASAYVDATDAVQMKQASNIMENLYFGIGLPDAWVAGMQTLADGDTWDVAGPANQNNGHCVAGLGYTNDGRYLIDTWGFEVYLTPAAAAMYAVPSAGGETHTIVSKDSLDPKTGKTAFGFDYAALTADIAAFHP